MNIVDEMPPAPVALVNLPFAYADRPSIQCGLLKASLARAGIRSDVHYLNLELAAELGADLYDNLATVRTECLLGEWLWGRAAFGTDSAIGDVARAYPDVQEVLTSFGLSEQDAQGLRDVVMPAMLAAWLKNTDWGRYRVIGFTSTFEQQLASLAMARAIKAQHPHVVIVMGGANFFGDIGRKCLELFDWIDYIATGEADHAFPALVQGILSGDSCVDCPGIVSRAPDGSAINVFSPPVNLEDLPTPDYSDYLNTIHRLGRARVIGDRTIQIPFESSRGCYWAARRPCSFCGLNAGDKAYRTKTPERTVSELEELSRATQVLNFEATDRVLDRSRAARLAPLLAAAEADYTIFYAVRPSLQRRDIRDLVSAGICQLQPGIESLNTELLGLMNKGSDLLTNIRFLKWSAYYGAQVGWNLILGIPGQEDRHLQHMTDLVPRLLHLPPPTGVSTLWIDRYSSYFSDARLRPADLRPRPAYGHAYPLAAEPIEDIAFYWEAPSLRVVTPAAEALREAIGRWQEAWTAQERPSLVARQGSGFSVIEDRRDGTFRETVLHGATDAAYRMCMESSLGASEMGTRLGVDSAVIAAALDDLSTAGLAVCESGQYLALALPAGPTTWD